MFDTARQNSGSAAFTARPVARDLVAGAVAGAAATWLMNQTTTILYEKEDDAAKQREDQARGGETAYAIAAGRIARAMSVDLDKDRRSQLGTALHWTLGIGAGIGYALARRRWPGIARGAGLPFGIAFFLLMDEGMNTALHFTPPPRAFPWQAHARGAAGHAIFGAATHAIVAALARSRPRAYRMEALLSTM